MTISAYILFCETIQVLRRCIDSLCNSITSQHYCCWFVFGLQAEMTSYVWPLTLGGRGL